MIAIQPRQKCECGLSFRYPHDFEEHKRVGCVVKSSDGPTFSDKDVEPQELPAEVEQELVQEAVAEEAPAEAPKTSKRSKK